jgi:hypothetical protein
LPSLFTLSRAREAEPSAARGIRAERLDRGAPDFFLRNSTGVLSLRILTLSMAADRSMASVLFVRFTGILVERRAGPPVFLFDEFGGGGGARAGMGSVRQAGDRNIMGIGHVRN